MKKYFHMFVKAVLTTLKVFRNKVSLDFFWRYLCLLPLDMTSTKVSKKTREMFYIPLMNRLKKPFLFTTSFWVFVWKTFDARARMHKDYEYRIREYIIKHYHTYKPYENDVYCMNIWANQWRWAIELAKLFQYNVVAFEAVPSIFNELMANVYLSWLSSQITAYNYALWNYEWTVPFHFLEEHEWRSHVDMKANNEPSLLHLPIKKFDDLRLPISYEKIKLFLIDVEWFEYEVLQWMQETLKKLEDVELIVEIFYNHPNREKVLDLMKNLWFKHKRMIATEDDYLFYKK